MALTTSDKEKLKSMGIDPDSLVSAITAEAETALTFSDDILFFKKEDIEARDQNIRTEGRKEAEAIGEKKGKELAAKSIKRAFGLSDDIPADIDKVREALKSQIEKGEPGVRAQVEALLKENESLKESVIAERGKSEKAIFDSNLIASMPSNRATNLTDVEYLDIVYKNLSFEKDGEKTIVKKAGNILQDPTTKAPLDISTAIGMFFQERGFVTKEGGEGGGRGGGDNAGSGSGTTGIKTMTAFKEKYKAENPGKEAMGAEFLAAVNKHASETQGFDYYN